jgi:hypothetical protein
MIVKKQQCPRCLGKRHVDKEDIVRLKMELFWIPGPCAYCDKKGEVDQDFINNVPADEAYLTTDLSKEERDDFIKGDISSLIKAEMIKGQIDELKNLIIAMYFNENKNSDEIVDCFMNQIQNPDTELKNELIKFVEIVINQSKTEVNKQ